MSSSQSKAKSKPKNETRPPQANGSHVPQAATAEPVNGNAVSGSTGTATRPDNATLLEWYRLMHLGRILDEKAANYLKQAKGWSYHAPCAGHEGIQLALGVTFHFILSTQMAMRADSTRHDRDAG